MAATYPADLDAILPQASSRLWANQLLDLLLATLLAVHTPRQGWQETVNFQITRDLLGISL